MRVLRFVARIWTFLLGIAALALTLALAVRFVLPLAPWLEHPTVTISPDDGATDVAPRSSITLTFSQPMNRATTVEAVQISPETHGTFAWSDDARILTFSPDITLTSNVTYTIRLGAQALGRWWQPLTEFDQTVFATARSPTLVDAFPNADKVATDTPLALVFNQPMVEPADLAAPVDLPQLEIDPPLPGQARWITPDTLLFEPTERMQPATRYQAVVVDLPDARGIPLDQPFTWTWTTQAPEVLSRSPDDGQLWVAPRQPLVLTLSQALDSDILRHSLQITPTIAGDLSETTLPDGTQVVTFTPNVDWASDQVYEVTLAPQTTPETWSFIAAPQPTLVGRFPGQGQLLPSGQAIRLIFSTPMDGDALQAGVSLDPPVDGIDIAVNDTKVRLQANLQPSTAYTLTVISDVTDLNGVPLGNDYRLQFLTEPAAPTLSLPDITAHFVRIPVGQPLVLNTERTNLSTIEARLYSFDEATLLRTLAFDDDDWQDFVPERYNQPFVRSWRVELTDPPNQTVRDSLTITNREEQPLAPGTYYLQLRTPEGLQEDVILVVSDIALTLKHSSNQVLVWAIDTVTGAPIADLPLTIYTGDAVVASGRTNDTGVWQVTYQHRSTDPAYVVIADGPEPAIVSSAPYLNGDASPADSETRSQYRVALFTDKSAYAPGETMRLGGFARRILPSGTITRPVTGTQIDLALQQPSDNTVITRTTVVLPVSGVVSASLHLDARIQPGQYAVQATLDDEVVSWPVQILPSNPPLDLAFDVAPFAQPNAPDALPLRVTDQGLPITNADVSWSTRAVPVDPESVWPDGFHFGADAPTSAPDVAEGSGTTDASGTFAIPLRDPVTLTQTVRYEVAVVVQEPHGPRTEGVTVVTLQPTGTWAGLRLPSRVVTSGERATVEMLAIDVNGDPVPNADITLDLYRRDWTQPASPTAENNQTSLETAMLTRRITADDQGRALASLPALDGGEYRVTVSAGAYQSSALLWVAEPGFTDWRMNGDTVLIMADRDTYRPGETARLLVALADAATTTLTTIEQGRTINAEVRPLQAGQLLDIPITADMAPNIFIGTLSVFRTANGAFAGVRAGYVELQVASDAPTLTTTLTPNATDYSPGETATITITTSNPQGEGVSANLIVAVSEAVAAQTSVISPQLALLQQFAPARSAAVTTISGDLLHSQQPVDGASTEERSQSAPLLPPPGRSDRVIYWNTEARTDTDGTLVLEIPLPAESAEWQVEVYATTGTHLFGYANTTLSARVPLEVQTETPPLLHIGDSTDVGMTVRNTTAISREVRATLAADGIAIVDNAPATQRATLLPGTTRQFTWTIQTGDQQDLLPVTANLRFTATAAGLETQRATLTVPINPSGATNTAQQTFIIDEPLSHTMVISTPTEPTLTDCLPPDDHCTWAALDLAVAPDARAAVARSATALAELSQRTVEQNASLLLLSATLAQHAPRNEQQIWEAQARTALTDLQAAQHENGGWGWWSGGSAHPFITGYMIEAQTVAKTVFAWDIQPDPRTVRLLREFDQPTASADLRAYIRYVLARTGQNSPNAARDLLDLELSAAGLAYIALVLPPDQSTEPLDRLLALSQRATDPGRSDDSAEPYLYWEATGDARMAHSSVSTTALAARALQQSRPDSPSLPLALRTIRINWSVDGWPTSFDSARAAAALLAVPATNATPPATQRQPYTLALNEEPLVDHSQQLTMAQQMTLAGSQLRARSILQIAPLSPTSRDATASVSLVPSEGLLTYRLTEQTASTPARTNTFAVHQDYLDPQSGVPIDRENIRPGQLVRIRLTLVALQPVPLAMVDVPLPATLVPVDSTQQRMPDLVSPEADPSAALGATASDQAIVFFGTDLVPGVYTQSHLVRATSVGTFAAPPPRATAAFDPTHGATGLPVRLIVAQP